MCVYLAAGYIHKQKYHAIFPTLLIFQEKKIDWFYVVTLKLIIIRQQNKLTSSAFWFT